MGAQKISEGAQNYFQMIGGCARTMRTPLISAPEFAHYAWMEMKKFAMGADIKIVGRRGAFCPTQT